MKNKLKLEKFLGQVVVAGLVAWLGGFFSPAPARADIAPPPQPGIGGLQPLEYQDTEVQMVYERVEITVDANVETPGVGFAAPGDGEMVHVSAWFVMHNQGSVDEQMQVVFPMASFNHCEETQENIPPVTYQEYAILPESFTVSINGTALATTKIIVTEVPFSKDASWCGKMEWKGFDVAFPVGEDVLIQVDYAMVADGDILYVVDYVLETGAAWKGPIEQAYIVFRTPYLVNAENIRAGTTPGYQMLYHEVLWSYQNLEPGSDDNIQIAFIAPRDWREMESFQKRIDANPSDVEAWLGLIGKYQWMAYWHRSIPNDLRAIEKIEPLYHQAIVANPNSAELHANYAEYFWYRMTDCWIADLDEDKDFQRSCLDLILPELDAALSLDSSNELALEMLNELRIQISGYTHFFPPTIPPTITLTPTITPIFSETPAPTDTRIPSYTPRLTRTATPSSTLTPLPTVSSSSTAVLPTLFPSAIVPTPEPVVAQPGGTTAAQRFGGLLVLGLTFAAGALAGVFIGRRRVQ